MLTSTENAPMSPRSLQEHLQQARDQQLADLKEWLAIPSISTLPEHRDDVRAAADWLAETMRRVGLENVEIIATDGHPVVYADWYTRAGMYLSRRVPYLVERGTARFVEGETASGR